ncbi:MAG: CPBP family intramembrane metalloprotease [Elusimicrobia bacterium]|nr:CPBP family intramembrane metalloprotease [Elusimicrobiota bacterium]
MSASLIIAALLAVVPAFSQTIQGTVAAPNAGVGAVGAAGVAGTPGAAVSGPAAALSLGPMPTAPVTTIRAVSGSRAGTAPVARTQAALAPLSPAIVSPSRSPIASAAVEETVAAAPVAGTAIQRAAPAAKNESLTIRVRTPDAAAAIADQKAFYDRSIRGQGESEVRGTAGADRPLGLSGRGPSEPAAKAEPPAPETPRSHWSRSAKVGYVASWLLMAVNFGFPVIADALGLAQNTTYQPPPLPSFTIAGVTALMLFIAGMAPVAEEGLFRGGVMTAVRNKFGRLKRVGQFWLPAIVSALLFVPLHEMSDPVTMAVYAAISLTLSRLYYKEGIYASIAAHSFYNFQLGLFLLASLFKVSLAFPALLLGVTGLPLLFLAARDLWAQRADRVAGRVVPYAVTPNAARMIASGLVAGTVLVALLGGWQLALGGGVFWIPSAYGWYLRSRRGAQ